MCRRRHRVCTIVLDIEYFVVIFVPLFLASGYEMIVDAVNCEHLGVLDFD